MRIAITGAFGQLGTELRELLGQQALPWGHREVDITDSAAVSRAIQGASVECVINAAAYNKVDLAEDEPEVAYRVNALGPRNLAQACQSEGIPVVHVSTDYVFGLIEPEEPWREYDAPGPISAYGMSKLAGEYFVRSGCTRHFVVRTCGVYGHAARTGAGKGNFVETMLRLGRERDELRIVDDQHCTPTSARDLAEAILSLLQHNTYGVYHATNAGATTWCQFAQEIFQYTETDVMVTPISTSEYPLKAQRPPYSVLNCSKLTQVLGTPPRPWQQALHSYLDERE